MLLLPNESREQLGALRGLNVELGIAVSRKIQRYDQKSSIPVDLRHHPAERWIFERLLDGRDEGPNRRSGSLAFCADDGKRDT